MTESAIGGALDTVGISQVVQGGFCYDLATGRNLRLSGKERGQALGSGSGMLALAIFGGRAWKPMHARGVRWREARMQGGSFTVRASGNPDDVVWHERSTRVGTEHYTRYADSTPAGRPQSLEDAMDAITARLHSMPRPGAPFREAAVARYSSVGPSGRSRGSDFVFMTRHGVGNRESIPDAAVDRLYSWLDANKLAKYPQVRLAQYMHTHPPARPNSLSGHSTGHPSSLMSVDEFVDPVYIGGDILGFELHLNHGAWASRHGSGLRPFVVRIAENGAIEEFAYIIPEAPQPRLPLGYFLTPGQAQARGLWSLLLPDIPPPW